MGEEKQKRLIVIDANSIIHRAFHALPSLTTKSGERVNAVYGFLLVLFRVIKEFQPDYIAACFDFPGKTFRHKKFEQYKAKRPKAPDELYNQIPLVKNVLAGFNIPVFEKEGFEADDIIGTISNLSPMETIILSGDQDVLQLVDYKTKAYILRKGVKDIILVDEAGVKEKYGFLPSQLLDFKALRGDASDNIPGVAGIGEKTAGELLSQFGNLNNMYKNIGDVGSPRIKELLSENKDQAFLSRELAEIKKDAPIDFVLEKCRWQNYDKEKIVSLLKGFEFYSLLNRLSGGLPQKTKEKTVGANLKLW